MSFENLVKIMLIQGFIKAQNTDIPHVETLLQRAKKDIFVAKSNLDIDEEVSYNYAYLSMLRCGRAVVFLQGFRPTDGQQQQHRTVIQLSVEILGGEFKNLIIKFDDMRRKRNRFTYDLFLHVSKGEAETALKTAEQFVDKVIGKLKKENPQLKLDF